MVELPGGGCAWRLAGAPLLACLLVLRLQVSARFPSVLPGASSLLLNNLRDFPRRLWPGPLAWMTGIAPAPGQHSALVVKSSPVRPRSAGF